MSTYEDDHNISAPSSTRTARPTNLPNLEAQREQREQTHRALAQAYELLGQNDLDQAFALLDEMKLKHESTVSDQFLDSLDRVLVKVAIKETADCPICTVPFAEQAHPLIVRLPCDAQHNSGLKAKGHLFDFECVAPWIKEHSTCPMCRFDVSTASTKRRERLEKELAKAQEEDDEEDEEEDWQVYG